MTTDNLSVESPAVQSYLTIVQSVISRMASNSSSCKTWCLSLVSAIMVVVADKGTPNYIWISGVPILLFLILDSYYLSLERLFRGVYNDFIRTLHHGRATVDDIVLVGAHGGWRPASVNILKAGCSFAVWPFYGSLAVMLLIVRIWIV
jgi:hypothetical protein